MCESARARCESTPNPNDILYWVWLGVRNPDGTVVHDRISGEVCSGPEEAGEQVDVPAFTLADFRRLPLPAGRPTIQPGDGFTLVDVPTNVMAAAEPVTLDTTLVGFPVRVRATPARYTWAFGDGGVLGPTADPGAAYPDLRTTHTYAAAGSYAVTLTTHWTGEYSVAGGPWVPVDGEAQVDAEPVTLQVLAGRNVLVDGTLGS